MHGTDHLILMHGRMKTKHGRTIYFDFREAASAHPTINMCEYRCDIVRFKISKTFLGKIITSVGCLHSFQGLLYYIVLTWKDIVLSREARLGKQLQIPWDASN